MEQKYFISYAAYTGSGMDMCILNDFININEPITRELIEEIQDSLVERLNENIDSDYKYYGTQIINFMKIS